MCSFQERSVSSLPIWGNVLTLQTAHRNFLILCDIVLHPNINFLISKQNKTPNIDPKMLNRLVLPFLDMSCLLHKQSFIINQINTSTAMNCIYSLPCFCSDSNDVLNKFSCLIYTWFQNLYINSKDRLNCI